MTCAARRLNIAGAVNEIIVDDETAAALREVLVLDPDCERLVFGMRAALQCRFASTAAIYVRHSGGSA
jgi:hypothetical protein